MIPSGSSKFVRADLHIHSYGEGGSFDVTDTEMTPANIVDTAIDNNLQIISITDHNAIENVKAAVDYAEGKNILVVPGIEVSTTQGHLLLYFATYSQLNRFYSQLTISSNRETCNQGISECLDIAALESGIGILAHIELGSGFEKTAGKFNEHMENLFSHKALVALEITKKENADLYTDRECPSNPMRNSRLALANKRNQRLDQDPGHYLPKVMNSDSHVLTKLGLNAAGDNKLTKLRVESLDFQSVKLAFQFHESRVRIEDLIPERVPHFKSVSFNGGLLHSHNIALDNNLTCIIGGRGTGKSTLLEAICVASGNASNKEVIDSDVWSDDIQLIYQDETGKLIELKRQKFGDVVNFTDEEGLVQVPIEYYGQGDAAKVLEDCDINPKSLLQFLDDLIGTRMLSEQDSHICDKLRENQSEARKITTRLSQKDDVERHHKVLVIKKKTLESDKVKDLVKYQSALSLNFI